MSESERRNTDFLDISAEHIEKRSGNSLDFIVHKDHGYLHAGRIAPQHGGEVCKFDETKLLRHRLIDKAKQLVYTPAPYRDLSVLYQAAGHALSRMVDACERCSLAR